jgi:hypothetical protein
MGRTQVDLEEHRHAVPKSYRFKFEAKSRRELVKLLKRDGAERGKVKIVIGNMELAISVFRHNLDHVGEVTHRAVALCKTSATSFQPDGSDQSTAWTLLPC